MSKKGEYQDIKTQDVKNQGVKIERFGIKDLDEYINMTKEFYLSGATVTEFDLEITKKNFREIMKDNGLVSGFFIKKENQIAGFVILSFMWSTEVGGKTVFIEELFVKSEFRKQGVATRVLSLVMQKLKDNVSRFRLEVCKTNLKALELYKQIGFDCLDYQQMIIDNF